MFSFSQLWCQPFIVKQDSSGNMFNAWGLNKLASISQTTFSQAFSRLKRFQLLNRISLCGPDGAIDIVSLGSGYNLVLLRHQTIDKVINEPAQWHIYASPGLIDLVSCRIQCIIRHAMHVVKYLFLIRCNDTKLIVGSIQLLAIGSTSITYIIWYHGSWYSMF